MKSTLETVAFFKNLRQTLDAMSDEDAGALMKALFAFDDGETPDLSGQSEIVKAIYPMAAESLDRLTQKRMNKARAQKRRKESANDSQKSANDSQISANDLIETALNRKRIFLQNEQKYG